MFDHICTFLSDELSKVRRARQQLLVVDIFECEPTPKMDIPDDLIGRPGQDPICVTGVWQTFWRRSDELYRYVI